MKLFYTAIVFLSLSTNMSYAVECDIIKTKIQNIKQERERIEEIIRQRISEDALADYHKKLNELEQERRELVNRGFQLNCFHWDG